MQNEIFDTEMFCVYVYCYKLLFAIPNNNNEIKEHNEQKVHKRIASLKGYAY